MLRAVATIVLFNRPFALWHHFTTTTRILQGFAFLCKLGRLLFKPHWDYNLNMKGKTKRYYCSCYSSKITPSCKWPIIEAVLLMCTRTFEIFVCQKNRRVLWNVPQTKINSYWPLSGFSEKTSHSKPLCVFMRCPKGLRSMGSNDNPKVHFPSWCSLGL